MLSPLRLSRGRAASTAAIAAIAAAAAAVACLLPAVASAADDEDVTLRLKGGQFEVKGTLKSYDGVHYVVDAGRLGTLTLDAGRFDCIGIPCAAPPTAKTSVAATPAAARASGDKAAAASPTATATDGPTAGSAGPATICISGSDTIGAGLLPDLVKAWAEAQGAKIVRVLGADAAEARLRVVKADGTDLAIVTLDRRGNGPGLAALKAGNADLAMTDRAASEAEAALLAQAGADIKAPGREAVIGLDALAVVVAPANPAVTLPIETIGRIFAGQITDWSELGGPARRITVYASDATTGEGSVFEAQVLRPQGRVLTTLARRMPSSEAVAEAVAQDPGGIGVTTLAHMPSAKPLNLEAACGLISEPTPFAVKTEEYPLSRRLHLYARGELGGPVKDLVSFALSAKAQPIVAEHRFVDQALDAIPFAEQTARFAHSLSDRVAEPEAAQMGQLLRTIGAARRLSTTIRFNSGTSQLEAKSQQDLQRLVEMLSAPQYKERTVLLIGFSDGLGTLLSNTTLSLRRALQVRSALLGMADGKLDPQRLAARGYGPLAPVACDDSMRGQQLNRRVEVWIGDAGAEPLPPPVRSAPVRTGKR